MCIEELKEDKYYNLLNLEWQSRNYKEIFSDKDIKIIEKILKNLKK